MNIKRDIYLNQLIRKKGNGLIKIVSGVRRCGKSYLLFNLFRESLLESGVDESHIITLALDDIVNKNYRTPESLYDFVISKLCDNDLHYVLLDEIQLVPDFESVLNGFLHRSNIDCYVTGSNSKFLSSDIITEFRGRGDEIRVYPLSFAEYYSIAGEDKYKAWNDYVTYGGMPACAILSYARDKENYLKQLFAKTYICDIVNRHNLQGVEEITELTNSLASAVGSLTNPQKITNTFLSKKKIKISYNTIVSYINFLEDSFLLEKSLRYDVKGRKYINSQQKYYFVDTGLRNACLNFRQQEESHLMENIIYNELKIRNYSVDIGMVDFSQKNDEGKQIRNHLEVDFVVNIGSNRVYIQSALSIETKEKIAQEENSLRRINDSFKKIIVQKNDCNPWYNENGILIVGLMDFLLNPSIIEN